MSKKISDDNQGGFLNESIIFTKCEGINTTKKAPVYSHRILLAKSSDGLNFTKLNEVIADSASVPDVMLDKDGNIRIYYIQLSCKSLDENIPVVAISKNNGKTWQYQTLVIEAPKEAPHCIMPKDSSVLYAPVDPEVILDESGQYRLYATCPNEEQNNKPMTFVFTSSDGITFNNAKATFIPTNIALDPVVVKTDKQWYMFNGNTNPATSPDGITFTESKIKQPFCPYKFTDPENNQERCYIIGDILTLENPKQYRMYLFGDTKGIDVKSIVSSDFENWTMEQESNQYILQIDNNSLESEKISFPTVVKLKDNSYLMVYEATIPDVLKY